MDRFCFTSFSPSSFRLPRKPICHWERRPQPLLPAGPNSENSSRVAGRMTFTFRRSSGASSFSRVYATLLSEEGQQQPVELLGFFEHQEMPRSLDLGIFGLGEVGQNRLSAG
jgi:hypothetical protein